MKIKTLYSLTSPPPKKISNFSILLNVRLPNLEKL